MTPPPHGASRRPHDVAAGLQASGTERIAADVRAEHLARVRARAVELGPAGPHGSHRGPGRWSDAARALGRAAAAIAALAVVGVVGTSGAAWASRDALPGEPLYGVKTATERAAGLLHPTRTGATEHLLERAERRLDEADRLAAGGRDGRLLAETVEAHEVFLELAAARAAGDADLEAQVTGSAANAVSRLQTLLDRDLPPTAADRARQSLHAVIQRLEERAHDRVGPPAGRPGPGPHADAPGRPPAGGLGPPERDARPPGSDSPAPGPAAPADDENSPGAEATDPPRRGLGPPEDRGRGRP